MDERRATLEWVLTDSNDRFELSVPAADEEAPYEVYTGFRVRSMMGPRDLPKAKGPADKALAAHGWTRASDWVETGVETRIFEARVIRVSDPEGPRTL